MVVPRLEGVPRDDADSYAQEFLKIPKQADVIKKGGAWLKAHKQVQIAVWASLSPGDRAEHRDPMSPALPRRAWSGVLAGVVYARRPRSSPPLVVRAITPIDLRHAIEAAETERGLR